MATHLKRANAVYVTLWVIAVVLGSNWVATGIIFSMQGGFADIGKAENGHYYLGEHGHYTEVPEATFFWNLWYFRISGDAALLSIVAIGICSLITRRFHQKHK